MPSYGGETLSTVTAEALDGLKQVLTAEEPETLAAVLGDFFQMSDELFSRMSGAEREELAWRNSWDLVAFILSLRSPTSTAEAVLGFATQ